MLRYVIQSAGLSWSSNYVLWPSDPSLEAMDLAWRGFCNRPLQTMCSYTLSPFFKTSHLNLGLAMVELLWLDCESLHTSKYLYLTREIVANNELSYTFTLILHVPLEIGQNLGLLCFGWSYCALREIGTNFDWKEAKMGQICIRAHQSLNQRHNTQIAMKTF